MIHEYLNLIHFDLTPLLNYFLGEDKLPHTADQLS